MRRDFWKPLPFFSLFRLMVATPSRFCASGVFPFFDVRFPLAAIFTFFFPPLMSSGFLFFFCCSRVCALLSPVQKVWGFVVFLVVGFFFFVFCVFCCFFFFVKTQKPPPKQTTNFFPCPSLPNFLSFLKVYTGQFGGARIRIFLPFFFFQRDLFAPLFGPTTPPPFPFPGIILFLTGPGWSPPFSTIFLVVTMGPVCSFRSFFSSFSFLSGGRAILTPFFNR